MFFRSDVLLRAGGFVVLVFLWAGVFVCWCFYCLLVFLFAGVFACWWFCLLVFLFACFSLIGIRFDSFVPV